MGIITRKLFALFASLSLLASPAHASCGARGFGSTFGVGSTDGIVTGYTTALSSTVTFSARIWLNGTGGGGTGRISCVISGGSCVHAIGILSSISTNLLMMPWSTTNGSWNWTAPSTGAWHSLVITYNAGSTSNVPVVYIDGSSVSVTTGTTPVGSYNPPSAAFNIGNKSDTGTRNWDGKISDYAYWNVILTASEAKALGLGASPLQVRPASLQVYLPLCGTQSNEPDWASRSTQTITGTKGIAGPPDQAYPFMRGGQ